MGLTLRDIGAGEAFLVIGQRGGDDRVVLAGAATLRRARQLVDALVSGGLEGYAAVVVERAGCASADCCRAGHEYTRENTIRCRDGSRKCRTCQRRQQRDYMRRLRARQRGEKPTAKIALNFSVFS